MKKGKYFLWLAISKNKNVLEFCFILGKIEQKGLKSPKKEPESNFISTFFTI
jgi:hypothetical protein